HSLGLTSHARIKHIAQRVTKQVPAHDEHDQGRPREDNNIPVLVEADDPVASKRKHLSPVSIANLRTDPEERKRRKTKDDITDRQGSQHEGRKDGIRQNMAE